VIDDLFIGDQGQFQMAAADLEEFSPSSGITRSASRRRPPARSTRAGWPMGTAGSCILTMPIPSTPSTGPGGRRWGAGPRPRRPEGL
jgi:hypothetical protein